MCSKNYPYKALLQSAANHLPVGIVKSISVNHANWGQAILVLLISLLASSTSYAQTTWKGSDPTLTCATNSYTADWFTATNWTNGVPTATTDAVIPDSNDNCAVYPEIITSMANPVAVVRNLTVQGNSSLDHSTIVLTTGELQVYGNYVDGTGGVLSQAAGTVFTLAGANQTFDGEAFQNLRIQGTGTKTLGPNVKTATIAQGINFANGSTGSAILATSIAQITDGVRFLDNSQASITGENDTNYILGNLSDSEIATQGQDQSFGGMGLTLNFTNGTPGLVVVVRTTGTTALAGTRRGISRIFQIRPSTITTMTAATATIQFLNHEAGAALDRNRLDFYTSTNGNQYVDRGYTTRGTNSVQLQGLANFQYLTLGNPVILPVTMLYFTAKGVSNGAQLTWGTATETDNAGFDVQVSTDGSNFKTLTTIVPRSPSSLVAQDYGYLDTEARTGIRYYRLRQVDLSGKESYTAVEIVKLSGGAGTQVIVAYPNPLRDGDQLQLAVQSGQAGTTKLRLTDTMGRVVLEQTSPITDGSSTISVGQPATLATGLYLAYVTFPDGSVQTIKVQKL